MESKKEISKEELLEDIERFIHFEAWKFKRSGVSHEDLVQSGIEGALVALESYDDEMGNTFLTFARPHIVGAIRREANQQVAGVPEWFRSQILIPTIKTIDRLTDELGREPVVQEVIEDADLRADLVDRVEALKNVDDEKVTDEIVLALEQAAKSNMLSLEDIDADVWEPADPGASVEEIVEASLAREEMELLMHRILNDRQLMALTMKFGMNGQDESALKDIATELGISPPRAHQIVRASLKRIENDPELRRIAEVKGYRED